MVEWLPFSGAEFQQARPQTLQTPLIAAAFFGHTGIVRMLLERAPNTDVDYIDFNAMSAMLVAAQCHHFQIIRTLADHGGVV